MWIVRRHDCTRVHLSHKTFAQCVWRAPARVDGEGPWVAIAHGRRGTTVMLRGIRTEAEAAQHAADTSACGEHCRRHPHFARIDMENS